MVHLIGSLKQGKRFGLRLLRGFGATPDDLLGDGSLAQRLFEAAHFRPVLRQNGNGTSPMADDVSQLLPGTELTIGHIKEVWGAVNLAQTIPRLDVSGLIVAVAG